MISICVYSRIKDFEVGCGYECDIDVDEMIVVDEDGCDWPCFITETGRFSLYSEDADFKVVA